ncbi:hypothetical protein EFA46_003115 [Halarchaeum sp. CBA1220]|uniref:Major facilitator superfamily (MFS) profile domain-containing protein n=1 Tax=Halarchaeum grantii TaxID=1193105 RepID=A0A830F101_9EURY|nr:MULTISPECIES: hypothetical protein [Halarchaeum]QLC33239.1 hypothetical protein EFA46_003115 [Halarchaeum sp. CBA1220]GGL28893.1 hypothetical protein GCM10009037_10760 [Halarchaeum grantii]
MGRYGDLDYPTLTKRTTLLSACLVVGGFLLADLGSALTTLPGWAFTVATDAEAIGALGIVLCPFVFGVLLPLTE